MPITVGPITVGAVRETAPGEHRVALVPEVAARLRTTGIEVLVESGAGRGALLSDEAYTAAGATITTAADLYARADIVLCISPPQDAALRSGQAIVGLLDPAGRPERIRDWARAGVTAISLDRIPRTLSRAQSMDVLTSQASIAGYKAALVAANAYGGYLPMLTTAAGTVKPATVLVLGAGVAGLQAIATARRLGAVVTGYDVRPQTRAEITSLGARFLELGTAIEAAGAGGYARELTEEERQAQQRALDSAIAGFDVVITAAAVPGRRPPLLVSEQALKAMRPGTVVVDTACGPLGGNVALSQPDATAVLFDGVTVVGAGNLAAQVPAAASTAYARNLRAVLESLIHDGALEIEPQDEVHAAIVLAHAGRLLDPAAGRDSASEHETEEAKHDD
jgi:proton-translocating NAD(P)+ transhydrogenase subunit alpha